MNQGTRAKIILNEHFVVEVLVWHAVICQVVWIILFCLIGEGIRVYEGCFKQWDVFFWLVLFIVEEISWREAFVQDVYHDREINVDIWCSDPYLWEHDLRIPNTQPIFGVCLWIKNIKYWRWCFNWISTATRVGQEYCNLPKPYGPVHPKASGSVYSRLWVKRVA